MSSNKETLVILTPGFPENEADTVCLPMQQQFIRSLKELFPELNIIVLSFQYPYFKKTYKWFGITVTSYNGRNKGGLSRLLLRQRLYKTLKNIIDGNKITGLLSFWYGECALVGKRFASKYRLRHYCWMFGQDAKKENKYPGLTSLKANELIALSDFLQDEFEKNHGTRPQHVIPPGIEPKQFNSLIKEKDIDVLAAGSLIPLKQYDIFIETIAEIKKKLPNVKTILIGNGPEKENLQNLIIKFELQSNITLTGELSHPEVLQWMQRAKLFLHPSSYEGFGVACLEALYAGAHVISFCNPMKKDIRHWHIVRKKEEMKEKGLSILQCSDTAHTPCTPFLMIESVKKIKELFCY